MPSQNDPRPESQKLIPESLAVKGSVKRSERARFLNPLVRHSFREAESHEESLTILRPRSFEIEFFDKTPSEMDRERLLHAALADQLSLFDSDARPLEPCPVVAVAHWCDQDGKKRRHECDDWETSAAFSRFARTQGHAQAIETLRAKYEDEYFEAGLVLAFSTHSRRNVNFGTENQWLLVGLIRLDHHLQQDLLLQ